MAAVPAFALKTGNVSVSGAKLTLAAGPAAVIAAKHHARVVDRNAQATRPLVRPRSLCAALRTGLIIAAGRRAGRMQVVFLQDFGRGRHAALAKRAAMSRNHFCCLGDGRPSQRLKV